MRTTLRGLAPGASSRVAGRARAAGVAAELPATALPALRGAAGVAEVTVDGTVTMKASEWRDEPGTTWITDIKKVAVPAGRGERHIFGAARAPSRWAPLAKAGTAWSGGTWNGNVWNGSSWTGRTWSGRTWSARTWSSALWPGQPWL